MGPLGSHLHPSEVNTQTAEEMQDPFLDQVPSGGSPRASCQDVRWPSPSGWPNCQLGSMQTQEGPGPESPRYRQLLGKLTCEAILSGGSSALPELATPPQHSQARGMEPFLEPTSVELLTVQSTRPPW